MEMLDLTHTFVDRMPVYPGDPQPSLVQIASVAHEGFTDHQLTTGMHVGTHIDAPLHFIEDGKWLDEIGVERLCGRGVVLDARGRATIDEDLLDGVEMKRGDVALVCTGHDKHFGKSDYYKTFPMVTKVFAQKLVERGAGMLGLDTPSPDGAPYAVHKILLGSDVLILENVAGLEQLLGVPSFTIMALPPKLHTEGAPVRVVAMIE
jgi:kynurenine formamidase